MVDASRATGERYAERPGFDQGAAGSRRESKRAPDQENSTARAAVVRWPVGQSDWGDSVLAGGAIGRRHGDEAVGGSGSGSADRDQRPHHSAHGGGGRGLVRRAEPRVAGRRSGSAEALFA